MRQGTLSSTPNRSMHHFNLPWRCTTPASALSSGHALWTQRQSVVRLKYQTFKPTLNEQMSQSRRGAGAGAPRTWLACARRLGFGPSPDNRIWKGMILRGKKAKLWNLSLVWLHRAGRVKSLVIPRSRRSGHFEFLTPWGVTYSGQVGWSWRAHFPEPWVNYSLLSTLYKVSSITTWVAAHVSIRWDWKSGTPLQIFLEGSTLC